MEKEIYSDIYEILNSDEDLFDIVEEIEYDDYEFTGECNYD